MTGDGDGQVPQEILDLLGSRQDDVASTVGDFNGISPKSCRASLHTQAGDTAQVVTEYVRAEDMRIDDDGALRDGDGNEAE